MWNLSVGVYFCGQLFLHPVDEAQWKEEPGCWSVHRGIHSVFWKGVCWKRGDGVGRDLQVDGLFGCDTVSMWGLILPFICR